MTPPVDWTITLSDHGGGRLVAEVREHGRVIDRRTLSLDEVLLEQAIEQLVERTHPTRRPHLRSVRS